MNCTESKLEPENPVVNSAGFFNEWWQELESRGWEAVVLHSWQDLPERINSDIDYAVRGPRAKDLLRFLADYSRRQGWRLVQAIEHEPGAFFCVCQQVQPPFEALQLDVTWSYSRLGHQLIPAELIFEGSRSMLGKFFHVPSVGSEFVYLLAKAAAKGKDFDKVRVRLTELLNQDAAACYAMTWRCFGDGPKESGIAIEKWTQWFAETPAFAAVRRGRRLGTEEIRLYLRRILEPTGFLMRVGMAADSRDLEQVMKALGPSFRSAVVEGPKLSDRLRRWLRRVRTTLVVKATGATDVKVEAAVARGIELLAERMERRINSTSGQ